MLHLTINKNWAYKISHFFSRKDGGFWVIILSTIAAVAATVFDYSRDYIVRYGDSESHLNIAKRVIDSITPGFAQLGGIWLPIPHLLMVPFVHINFLWRTGLAGSIVSGCAFVIAAYFLYKTTELITKSKSASFIAALIFILNPNLLYLQSTPMTEVLLIAFFALSTFYFIKFLQGKNELTSLLLAAFYGFCSVLTRYDGWFLVALEALAIVIYYFPWNRFPTWGRIREFLKSENGKKAEGYLAIFSTLAFFGILIWLVWGFLILGDPLYFTHSVFSAKSQQNEWLARGELPAYRNIFMAFLYYFVTAMSNAGVLIYCMAITGLIYFLSNKGEKHRWLITLILGAPFVFNIVTLFLGQSVIFIPSLTPSNFEWKLFNVRYGVMAVPLVGVLTGYLFYKVRRTGKIIILCLFFLQLALYQVGYTHVISWEDGVTGLSSAKRPDAERWLKENYDYGMVLMDDYARTVSVVRSGVPMEQMIYIGNKPYWEESLVEPEKYARWIVMQQNDSVWKELIENPAKQARLYKYFEKVYTSPEILIFRRQTENLASTQSFWNFECVDTMKYSRDQARAMANDPNLTSFVDQEMTLIKNSGATCVSLGTPYDEEFVPYLTVWVNKAREKGLKIWFRGNMSGWEGWFDYPVFTSPEQQINGVQDLITKHPELFSDGDIFTPAPEPENGIIGDPRDSQRNKTAFFDFLPKSYEGCLNSFKEINKAVSCGYYSFNGDVAKNILTKDLLVKIGDVVVIDHNVKTPDQLISDVEYLNQKFGSPVVLGEFGAPIPDINGSMTQAEQADYIDRIMTGLFKDKDIVQGMNYWVLRGGSTALVDNPNNIRSVYNILRNYYYPAHIQGIVTDTLGNRVNGAEVNAPKYGISVRTNILGEYDIVLPAGEISLKIQDKNWTDVQEANFTIASNGEGKQDFVVNPVNQSWWYKLKLWWHSKK